MGYLVFAVLMASVLIAFVSIKHRSTDDPTKSVDSFNKAIKALDSSARKAKGRPKARS